MSLPSAPAPRPRRRAPLVAALVVAVALLAGSVAIAVPWLGGTARSAGYGPQVQDDQSGVPAWMDRMHDAMHGTSNDGSDGGWYMGPRSTPAPSGTF
jgi:hypothetical protein